MPIAHAAGAHAVQDNFLDQGMCLNRQVGAVQGGAQVCHCGAAAFAVPLRDLVKIESSLPGPIEIIGSRVAGLLRRLRALAGGG